jgi:GTPase
VRPGHAFLLRVNFLEPRITYIYIAQAGRASWQDAQFNSLPRCRMLFSEWISKADEKRANMFVDEAKIYVKAGDGGNGCMAFRREKFVPRGGPSGGDGGAGGSIILEATQHDNTLLRYRFNREFRGDRGRHGEGSNRTGHSGADTILAVPVGTMVIDEESGERLADLTKPGQRLTVAHGGRGGRGNQHFAKPWHQAPRESEEGQHGEEHHLRLELRLLADVGLVGFPNAGKSTLISRISAARPKIADYPFTTLEPHLGVVSAELSNPGDSEKGGASERGGAGGGRNLGRTFVVADLPGLIEGANQGVGLGTRFLRHIERTRLIAHLVDTSDASDRDPVRDFEIICGELAAFSESLAAKPMIVVATKLDATTDRTRLDRLRAYCADHQLEFHAISSASGAGIPELVRGMATALERLGPAESAAEGEESDAPGALSPPDAEAGESRAEEI